MKYKVVPESVPESKIVKYRHREGGKFTESQSTTAVGGMESLCGGVPEQRLYGYQGYHKLPENIQVMDCWVYAKRKF